MATIEQRTGRDGQQVYRVKVRRKGSPSLTATFSKISEAKKWAQVNEGAVLEGRYFNTAEAKRHTLTDVIDRYIETILPHKSHASLYMQPLQLTWWKAQLGHYVLADITPALIAEYRDKLFHSEGIRRKNSTVRRYLAALSHVFTITVKEWGWLDDSPSVRSLSQRNRVVVYAFSAMRNGCVS